MTSRSEPRESPRWVLLLAVTLCYASVGLSVGLIPSAVHHAGGNDAAVGVAMGAYAYSAIAARVFLGSVMDRWGYRATLVLSAVFLVGSTVLCATSATAVIGLARLLLGVGVGGMMAAATAWAVELPSARARMGSAIGSVGTVNYVALALFAPLGTLLENWVGPSAGFLLASLFPAGALLVLVFATAPRAPGRPAASQDVARGRSTNVSRITCAVLGPGSALLCSGFGYAALVSFGPQWAQTRGLAVAGVVVLVYGASMVAARVLLGSVVDGGHGKGLVVGSFAVETFGLLAVWWAPGSTVFILGVVVVGVGMALIYPLLGAQVAQAAGPVLRGRVLSWFGACINLGIGTGSVVVGAVAHSAGLGTAMGVAAAVVLGGAVLALLPSPSGSGKGS